MSLALRNDSAFQDENLALRDIFKSDGLSSLLGAYGLPEASNRISLHEETADFAFHSIALGVKENNARLNSLIANTSQGQIWHGKGENSDTLPILPGKDDLTGFSQDAPNLLNIENVSTPREMVYGSLDFSDDYNPTRRYALKDDYWFSSAISQTIQIHLNSSDFNPYLQLVDPLTGTVLAHNNDSGSHAQLSLTVEAGAQYLIRATSNWAFEVGDYRLTAEIISSSEPESLELPDEFDPLQGYGLVDAAAAVASAIGNGEPQFAAVVDVGGHQWSNDMIQAPEVWAEGYTGQGVTVAVIDSGIDINHEDLRDNIWVNTDEILGDGIDNDSNGYTDDRYGWNFGIGQDNNNVLPGTLDPGQSHGTHVAGTIAAADNGFGITGVAYSAEIMAIRMGDVETSESGGRFVNPGNLAQAIRYAVDNGADVINMSLGWSDTDGAVEDALAYASAHDVITVSAAGNSGEAFPSRPPGHYAADYGLVVGAVDHAGHLAGFSNRSGSDSHIRYVTAPGVNIYSAVSDPEKYDYSSGTSMAAPHVAGVVALMLSASTDLTHGQVRDILTSETSHMVG